MRYPVFVVAVGAMLGFSLAEDFLEGVDNTFSEGDLASTENNPSNNANIFLDDGVGSSPNLAEQTLLASNDITFYSPSDAYLNSDFYSDPPLYSAASTCDDRANADEGDFISGKLRARDSPPSMCYSKDPPTSKDSAVKSWVDRLPNIFFGGNRNPKPEPEPEPAETQRFGRDRLGNPDKCWMPFKFNLCCEGDLDGNLGEFYDALSIPAVHLKVEDCYESMCTYFFVKKKFDSFSTVMREVG